MLRRMKSQGRRCSLLLLRVAITFSYNFLDFAGCTKVRLYRATSIGSI